jgi:aspartate aminotransferase
MSGRLADGINHAVLSPSKKSPLEVCKMPGSHATMKITSWKSLCVLLSSASAFTPINGFKSVPSTTLAASLWDDVVMGPPDAILGIAGAFRSCTDERKVNVCIGAYRDENGQPWVLPSVRQAEDKMIQANENKEYLPIEGDQAFVEKALKFAYGQDAPLERIAGVQTLSGTGACRIGGKFLANFYPGKSIYLPVPTWGNHHKIFAECNLNVQTYRYYDRSSNRLDLAGMMEDFESAPDGSILLLHACAHNPTGCDPTEEQWGQLMSLIETKKHLVFFDSAYQGFASGDAEADAKALRRVVNAGLPVLLAQSFAKNFGLYGERCGTLSVVCKDAAQKEILMSQLRNIIRPMYSSPPKHGSSIVKIVLSDEALTAQYYKECAKMAERIQLMRTGLVAALKEAGSTHDWSHVTEQIGMFAFTGMSVDMCDQLTKDHAIYLTRDGRISIAGLNDSNIEYVAKAVHAVTDGKSITSA